MPTVNSHFCREASSFSRVCRLRALTALASCFSCFRRGTRSCDSVVVVWRDRIGCETAQAGRGLEVRLADCGRGRWHCGQASERVARGHCRSHGRSMSPRAGGRRGGLLEGRMRGWQGGRGTRKEGIVQQQEQISSTRDSLGVDGNRWKDGIKRARGGDYGPYHTVFTLTAE